MKPNRYSNSLTAINDKKEVRAKEINVENITTSNQLHVDPETNQSLSMINKNQKDISENESPPLDNNSFLGGSESQSRNELVKDDHLAFEQSKQSEGQSDHSKDLDARLIRRKISDVNPSNNAVPKGDILIFILSYDDETYDKAQSYRKYDWAFPILVPGSNNDNPLFENIVFQKFETILLPFICNRHKYIGLLSWKAKQKININSLSNQIRMKQYTKSPFIHFNPGPVQIYRCHPFLKTIWDDIFSEKLGPIEKNKFGYCNYFVARKDIFEKYVKEMQRYIPIVLAHPNAFHDAKYPGGLSKEKLIKICGKPFYPHVPFVFERTNLPILKSLQ
jgi:hypothetical protein